VDTHSLALEVWSFPGIQNNQQASELDSSVNSCQHRNGVNEHDINGKLQETLFQFTRDSNDIILDYFGLPPGRFAFQFRNIRAKDLLSNFNILVLE
jgi:hypothetical protein